MTASTAHSPRTDAVVTGRVRDATVRPGSDAGLCLTPIGGPSALVEMGGLRLLVDPTFDEPGTHPVGAGALTKTRGPALLPDDLPPLDAVLLSHDQHPDNLDRTGREVAAAAPLTLTTPEGAFRLGGTAVGLEPWQEQVVEGATGSVRVTAVPALHGPEGSERMTGTVTGFVLTQPGMTTYVSGDNASLALVDQISERFPDIDVALLFAGAARTPLVPDALLTLTGAGAADAARRLGARHVLPVHVDGWEHLGEGRSDVADAFHRAGLGDRLVLVPAGSSVRFPGRGPAGRPAGFEGVGRAE